MTIHPTIAASKFASLVLDLIDASEPNDPVLPIARMIVGEQYHPPGEYDLKPLQMMRIFAIANPNHRMSKAADWSSDMVWLDRPDNPIQEEPVTPD